VPKADGFTYFEGQLGQATARPVDVEAGVNIDGSEQSDKQEVPPEGASGDSIVTMHPPTSLWDDAPRTDASYESPLYRTPLDNFMWLPRNPLERLDLDDGVNFFRVLLSRSEAGWRGVGRMPRELEAQIFRETNEATSSVESLQVADGGRVREPRKSITAEPLLPGSAFSSAFRRRGKDRRRASDSSSGDTSGEEIELPPIIAARVQHAEQEGDIEDAEPASLGNRLGRPSLYRAKSSASRGSRRVSFHRGSSQEAPSPSHEQPARPDAANASPAPAAPASGLPDVSPARSVDAQGSTGGEHLTTISSNDTATARPNASSRTVSPTVTPTVSPNVSSFRALASVVMKEARLEREVREKKEKKDSEGKARRASFAQILDPQGHVHG